MVLPDCTTNFAQHQPSPQRRCEAGQQRVDRVYGLSDRDLGNTSKIKIMVIVPVLLIPTHHGPYNHCTVCAASPPPMNIDLL